MVARNGALNAEKAMEALKGAEDKEKEIEVISDKKITQSFASDADSIENKKQLDLSFLD